MIRFDFSKFTEAGLRPVVKALAKHGLNVASVTADNKPRREAGFQVKLATIEFESGQKLVLKAKPDGSIFQVKLNGKALGIKHVDDPDRALLEVVDFVQANEKSFLKAKERIPRVKPPTPQQVVSTSLSDQIDGFQASLDGIKAQNEDLAAQLGTRKGSIAEKEAELASLQEEVQAEQARSEELQSRLDDLRGEAA